ncbi:integrase arm-type DNA-binding domain-containing protein [Bosea sp. (in: a-proteobacteria)]|uniref:integrase arm-type DNA-binding domain-containing protein n=1 Tax=Bosea sp. (in: a-proteobacteria) TaxID=1871050 RepID=UPI002B4A8ECB|nr:integrase arm-type DNA-binding domain-containing protein [Bosea sp. (in: a-proteobacteria)]WRH59301.1 MAG: hypothetical protein RSE11_05835 [Bosea sp. (in: a-proteobacteria)]
MPLSDAAIRGAKPADTRKKLSDGGGLQLWIEASGAKLWSLAYLRRDNHDASCATIKVRIVVGRDSAGRSP